MHIYFSGIGGHGIGPLAHIAQQAGYAVSGSDNNESDETRALQAQGFRVHIGQTNQAIAQVHAARPIDWIVFSSAILRANPDHPELVFAKMHGIKYSKRDELLKDIIGSHQFELLAVAGTHGKTTTTAMVLWLYKQLGIPVSYSVGAPISFGPMGQFEANSSCFVYECDEFDRNFLAFHPALSGITGIAWDHHEIFPTRDDYNQAFREFIGQSGHTIAWQRDAAGLGLAASDTLTILPDSENLAGISLAGETNRADAWLAVQLVARQTGKPVDDVLTHINTFPGLRQRMEQLAPNLYTNYAHTPEKIAGGLGVAKELAQSGHKNIVVLYEPLTNRRQHYIKDQYKDTFAGVKKLYWLPSYLAREDPALPVLSPTELIAHLSNPEIALPAQLDDDLAAAIKKYLDAGDLVVAMGASGAGSLDEWLRQHFATQTPRPKTPATKQ